MANLPNAMVFLPTAFDTYVQSQATGSPPPNQGLAQLLFNFTRTGATINTVAGFAYQPNSAQNSLEALSNFFDYILETWNSR